MASRTYRLVVEGELSDGMQPAFDGMDLTRADGNTSLTGPIRDQAELQGILLRVSDLGLTLLEAVALDKAGTRSAPTPRRDPGPGSELSRSPG